MALSRAFIKDLMYNPQALLLLAYMEHESIPDEVLKVIFKIDVLLNVHNVGKQSM